MQVIHYTFKDKEFTLTPFKRKHICMIESWVKSKIINQLKEHFSLQEILVETNKISFSKYNEYITQYPDLMLYMVFLCVEKPKITFAEMEDFFGWDDVDDLVKMFDSIMIMTFPQANETPATTEKKTE
jgi:hypothetical protein